MAGGPGSRSRRAASSTHSACARSSNSVAPDRCEGHPRFGTFMKLASDVATIPGWYGKLPSLGDFASRRLEADFIEPWDLWLGEAIQAQRDSMGDAWLDAYLQSPPWRFILMPGVLSEFDPGLILAGVLMPSVDRVGRYFPLTIAASIAGLPSSRAAYAAPLAGTALWLADNPDHPQLLVSKGLPANDDFIRMFGSTGREPGAETIY